MEKIVRTGISLEQSLLDKFDRIISKKGYHNRSEAIRDLLRDYVVGEDVKENRVVVGTLTMVYDHHKPGLSGQLVSLQHDARTNVLAATHVHLDHHNCLEVIIMKGESTEMNRFAGQILSLVGVKHGKLAVTTTGKDLS
ncbi:MAG: nickel-responsive transcriptional regulator NikR [Candidatus Acidiferrales bacterium]